MKKLFLSLALILIAASTFSQPTDAGTTQSVDIEAERHRIQGDRAREEAQYGQEEVACYARFAVTDCLREVRVRRREALANLRRQEIVLNELKRKQKSQERMERIDEKSAAQPVP